MDRISEIWLKFASIGFIHKVLDALKADGLITINKEPILDQELTAIVNRLLESEQKADQSVEAPETPKVKLITTESKIEDAIAYCENNKIKATVRNIAQYAGVSYSTVSRYKQNKV